MPADQDPKAASLVTAAVLVIGDEILSGRTKDKNIGYIAEYLTAIGIDLKEARVVSDDETEIVAALNALRARYTYVFTTGGIGPTHDDITAECVAKAFGVSIDYRSARDRHHAGAGRQDRHGDERSAHAHDAHPGRCRSGQQQGLRRARLLDRQCASLWPAYPRSCRRCSTTSHPSSRPAPGCCRKRSAPMRARAISAPNLAQIAKAHPDVSIGSYPFFDDGRGPNTNVVLRARDPDKLGDGQDRGRSDAGSGASRAFGFGLSGGREPAGKTTFQSHWEIV